MTGPEVERLKAVMEAVRPLHHPKGPDTWMLVEAPDKWTLTFREPGQTFQQYLVSKPNLPQGTRRVISVRPIGDLTPAQLQIVEITADYLQRFFCLPSRVEPLVPLGDVPARARRFQPAWGAEQIRTGYLLGKILTPSLPKDAVAHIGLTSSDLYPGEKWNFVFGQANLWARTGVWSLYHFGDPERKEEFRTVLLRALKVASHETGHMFSLRHCTKFQCVMNGTNSLPELDARPLDACPECMAKICWATGCDPARRYERLAAFCLRHRLAREQGYFTRSVRELRAAL